MATLAGRVCVDTQHVVVCPGAIPCVYAAERRRWLVSDLLRPQLQHDGRGVDLMLVGECGTVGLGALV